MISRDAYAVWNGKILDGNGSVKLGSGLFEAPYNFKMRFENENGTNPEELLGASFAACFTMALSATLTRAGFVPTKLSTKCTVHVDKEGDGFMVKKIELFCEGSVPAIDDDEFVRLAETAKSNCPIGKALASVPEIILHAKHI